MFLFDASGSTLRGGWVLSKLRVEPRFRSSLAAVLAHGSAARGSQGPSHPSYFSPLADALDALALIHQAQP